MSIRPDRAQDTEAIRAALNRSSGPRVLEADAALDRLVARLEAAEQALREWLAYTGLRQRAFSAELDPDDDEYASGRALIRKTDAALAAAAPGECDGSPTCAAEEHVENCVAGWATGAAPGETEQTP